MPKLLKQDTHMQQIVESEKYEKMEQMWKNHVDGIENRILMCQLQLFPSFDSLNMKDAF